MKVQTRDEGGSPICPICEGPVEKAGQFCSPECYQHFITAVEGQMVHMEVCLDLENQPWHTQDTETKEPI